MEKVREQLQVRKERAILVGVNLRQRGRSTNNNLVELTALAETAGAIIVDRFQQKLRRITPGTYIGKGKAEQLCDRVAQFGADVVIFDNDLSPGWFVHVKLRPVQGMVLHGRQVLNLKPQGRG
ncbi:MAG: hypothetical protein IIB89_01625, partial [Chloroflexi bacterium]|nr:hypothetical protein [Chloroflexota bacterium]